MTFRILLLVLLLGVLSCSQDDGIINTGPDGFPLDYSYTVKMNCYCFEDYVGPHKITVENGMIASYEFQGNGTAWPEDNRDIFKLDSLHNQAEMILSDGPDSQSVTRDSISGFITSCYFDIERGIADEEWGYEVTDLRLK